METGHFLSQSQSFHNLCIFWMFHLVWSQDTRGTPFTLTWSMIELLGTIIHTRGINWFNFRCSGCPRSTSFWSKIFRISEFSIINGLGPDLTLSAKSWSVKQFYCGAELTTAADLTTELSLLNMVSTYLYDTLSTPRSAYHITDVIHLLFPSKRVKTIACNSFPCRGQRASTLSVGPIFKKYYMNWFET